MMRMLTLLTATLLYSQITTAQLDAERLLDAGKKKMAAMLISDEEIIQLTTQQVIKMDSASKVAPSKSPYFIRLNKLFAKHKNYDGMALNYKVYLVDEVNAFACADGSVRVFKGLMDKFTDNEILAVIGHEIGHVKNKDTKDAIKKAYNTSAAKDVVASTNKSVATIADSQFGAIGEAVFNTKFSRQQESEADVYGYEFLKINKYPVMAMVNAFNKLASLNGGTSQKGIESILASHPDSKKRADAILEKAIADGLDKIPAEPVKATKVKKKAPVKKKI